MVALMVFVVYILVGLIANWGSIFLVYGTLMKVCKNHSEVYFDVFARYNERKIGFVMEGYPYLAKVAVTQILWPVNVFNTYYCGLPALKEAKETIRRMNNNV